MYIESRPYYNYLTITVVEDSFCFILFYYLIKLILLFFLQIKYFSSMLYVYQFFLTIETDLLYCRSLRPPGQ